MLIFCAVDDDNGLMFNHRRQSMDRVLRERIVKIARKGVLWMDSYSARQFDPLPVNAHVSEEFLVKAGAGEFCFVEDRHLSGVSDRIEAVYLFHWNRRYPSDFKLDFIPAEHGFYRTFAEDFAGYSHDDITMELWEKAVKN